MNRTGKESVKPTPGGKNMCRVWIKPGFTLALACALLAGVAPAQQQSKTSDRDLNLEAYIELMRSDVQTQKVAIITQVMNFDDADSAKFWPIYREYQFELSKLGDARLALIKDYADHYADLSDEKARELALGALDLEGKRTELKKKYFDRFANALSAKTAARFFQVENQLLMLIDLQVSSMLPVVPVAQ